MARPQPGPICHFWQIVSPVRCTLKRRLVDAMGQWCATDVIRGTQPGLWVEMLLNSFKRRRSAATTPHHEPHYSKIRLAANSSSRLSGQSAHPLIPSRACARNSTCRVHPSSRSSLWLNFNSAFLLASTQRPAIQITCPLPHSSLPTSPSILQELTP